jgi:hypothetical protein
VLKKKKNKRIIKINYTLWSQTILILYLKIFFNLTKIIVTKITNSKRPILIHDAAMMNITTLEELIIRF